jgi:hypothetical protein
MNGNPQMNGILKNPAINNPLVQALETILAKVKTGEISTVAIIPMAPQGYFPPLILGPQRVEMCAALDFAKASLLAEIFSPPKAGIVRAPEMPGLKVGG